LPEPPVEVELPPLTPPADPVLFPLACANTKDGMESMVAPTIIPVTINAATIVNFVLLFIKIENGT
jgi:hypothetical protein